MTKKKNVTDDNIKELAQFVVDKTWWLEARMLVMQSLMTAMLESIKRGAPDHVITAIGERAEQIVEHQIQHNGDERSKFMVRGMLAEALNEVGATPPQAVN